MTKREIKKQQKQQKLEEKIKNMSDEEYHKTQIKLDNVANRMFGLSLICFTLVAVFGLGSIFTVGTGLLPIFASISLGSLAGICASSAAAHSVTTKIKENNKIRVGLVSIEEVEEQQKQQTQEIINRIKKEANQSIIKEKTTKEKIVKVEETLNEQNDNDLSI